jgi:hypothetical protein
MNQHNYKDILERELIDTFHVYDLDPSRMVFQQGDAGIHTTKSVCHLLNL